MNVFLIYLFFRTLYESATVPGLVEKLLCQRPAVFINSWDHFLLLDGTPGFGGFEHVGHDDNPKKELCLSSFNSYDEMRLSALISVSSLSPFINDGGINNCGVVGNGVSHELEGVIVGQVGARFEKEGFMEWQDCIIKRNQNTIENGYGKDNKRPESRLLQAWANLWGVDYLPTFDEVNDKPDIYEYIHIKDAYLHKNIYKARIQMLAEVLLVDASTRAHERKTKAFVHVEGLGLTVWIISSVQKQLYIEAWIDAVNCLPHSVTRHISFINFSSSLATTILGLKSGDKIPTTDIKILFTARERLERVPRGHLLAANYSLDSNAIAGSKELYIIYLFK